MTEVKDIWNEGVPIAKASYSGCPSSNITGECFSVSTQDKDCFSITTSDDYNDSCFVVRCVDDRDAIELPPPPTLYVKGFSKIRDIINHGQLDLIVLGWYTPPNGSERPVIAIINYSSASSGDISNLISVGVYTNLDAFSDGNLDINDCSLEAFDTTSGLKNIAIVSTDEVVYISSIILEEISVVTDASALSHPFAYTEDTYWTTGTEWDGTYHSHPFDDLVQSKRYMYRPWFTLTGDEPSNIDEWDDLYPDDFGTVESAKNELCVDGWGYDADLTEVYDLGYWEYYWHDGQNHWVWSTWTLLTGYFDFSGTVSRQEGGYSTISKNITSGAEELTEGLNHFTGVTSVLPRTPYNAGATSWSGQSPLGARGELLTMPSEVNLGSAFLNVREGIAFGDGYFVDGGNGDSVAYYWENRTGGYVECSWYYQDDFYVRSYRYLVGTASTTEGKSFYLAPFIPENTKKVQVADNWYSMGTVAISKDFGYIIEEMPSLYGIPSAIVGNRCLVPIETPTADAQGNMIIIDQEFNMDDEKIATRPIIFP